MKNAEININNNEDVFRIKINGKDEYIDIDLLDMSLPYRVAQASIDLEKEYDEYETKLKDLCDKHKDDKDNDISFIIDEYTINQEFCNRAREIFDSFLGKGACQKIFGDKNRVAMFNVLMEQLEKIFKDIEFNKEETQKKIYNKWKPNDKKNVI